MKNNISKAFKIRLRTLLFFTALLTITKIAHTQSNNVSLRRLAEDRGGLSLQQILDSIDARNPGLQQFELKTKSSYAMGEAAKAWMPPTAGLGVSEFPYGSVSKTNNGMMPRKMLMLRLKQMFPNFNKQKKEQEYYQSFANQNEDDRATMQNMLFAKAKMAYYDAFIAEKKVSIINEQQKQLQLLIQIAEGRLAYNKARLPNIYKARAKLSDLQSMQVKLQSKTKQAVAILNSLMNLPLSSPLSIDTSINLQQINILQIDSTYVRTNRSDIAHISDAIHTMKLKQKMTAQMTKPSFGITWDNMRMPAFENNGMYMFSAMAMISIPIAPWFSKGYKSKINAMDYQIQAMRKMKEHQVLEALGNIQKDWLKLQAAKRDLEIFKNDVIPAYAKTYQANMNAFSENTGDIYETLSAWNELTMKKIEYYNKLMDVLTIRVILETEMQTPSP